MEQIINAIEATNATVDQLVQQGNELCDDVDNLRAADERLSREVAAVRSSVAADKEHISANKEAIASQAKDLAEVRAAIADLRSSVEANKGTIAALDARVANIEQQLNMIARLQNELADSLLRLAEARRPADEPTQTTTPDMAALIARIPKPDAVRTRGAKTVEDAPSDAAPTPAVVQTKAAPSEPAAPQTDAAPSDAAVRAQTKAAKPTPRKSAQNNAVETRAYARQYMIENGAKVEQLRDPAAIEATVASDAFAAWLAAR